MCIFFYYFTLHICPFFSRSSSWSKVSHTPGTLKWIPKDRKDQNFLGFLFCHLIIHSFIHFIIPINKHSQTSPMASLHLNLNLCAACFIFEHHTCNPPLVTSQTFSHIKCGRLTMVMIPSHSKVWIREALSSITVSFNIIFNYLHSLELEVTPFSVLPELMWLS